MNLGSYNACTVLECRVVTKARHGVDTVQVYVRHKGGGKAIPGSLEKCVDAISDFTAGPSNAAK